ncbi:HAD-IIB family hydrolase [Seongchinamella unica]|uniref:HAD-IIB family hydrolase n=1 Tax=Seongchinamella unica TaxID=2547392 RepID=A0A4R5LSS8_9GAMM|nr:HAD-IIB family hydrolase [Seongchinamella unica]TDG13985.1 HAD-IIB family hydrolase [Seongchinamella unica]
MRILATDLDRTLLPNGHWPADPQAIPLFNQLTSHNDILLVYVTGRNLALTEQAISEYGIRHPDVLCADVGSTIRTYAGGQWKFDEGWEKTLHRSSPRWEADLVHASLVSIQGLRKQEPDNCNQFKQSYYVEHGRHTSVLQAVETRLGGRFDEVIIYSYDSSLDRGLLDILPASATKKTALEYVSREHDICKDSVVYCGDSGNDILPMKAGFSGVLVRNADQQLLQEVSSAARLDPQLRVYLAQGGFKGLNGYYTSGVIEGCYHYGIFTDDGAF